MTTQTIFIFSLVCLIAILTGTASAALPWESPGTISPNPTISLDDPPFIDQGGNQPWQAPWENNPPEEKNPPPDERISDPEPAGTPFVPDTGNAPDWKSNPQMVNRDPSPGERISEPPQGYPDPCPNPTLRQFIPPEPVSHPSKPIRVTDPYCDTTRPISRPVGNIYPVYDEPDYRYRYVSPSHWDDDDEYYTCSYHSSSWYRTGSLHITSSPARAEVWLNNKYRGKTPSSGYLDISNLVPDTYDLLVSYSGYISYSRTIDVGQNEVRTMNVVLSRFEEEQPIYTVSPVGVSAMSIGSEPAGASILLNNEYRGISPVTLSNVVPGEYTLILQKTGYNDFISKVQVIQGQTLPITAVMSLIPPTPQPTPPAPVQTPVPLPTRAGLPAGLVVFSLVAAAGALSRLQKR